MKKLVTVKDFKDAGLVFVAGDTHGNGSKINDHIAHLINKFNADDDLAFYELAWRTNTGVKPEFKGEIEVVFDTCEDVEEDDNYGYVDKYSYWGLNKGDDTFYVIKK